MYAGADEDKNQRRDDRVRNTYLRLQPLGILGIALVDALKEFLAVLDILRVRIDLIHQTIFFAVLFCRPVGNLLYKPDNILGAVGAISIKSSSTFSIQYAVDSIINSSTLLK